MPTSTTFPTKEQITNLIDEIVEGGNYTADELRLLLTNILNSLYEPFYNAASNPAAGSNQTANYKAGSLGKNSSTGRYFVCSSAAASTATWEQISLDKGYQAIVSSTAGLTYTVSGNSAYVLFAGVQITTTINLPLSANSYSGKTVKIYFSPPASNNTSTSPGITFQCPEPAGTYTVQVNTLNDNYYRSNTSIEFLFNGSAWIVSEYNATPQDLDVQSASVTNGGSVSLSKETSISRLTTSLSATVASYTVRLPQDPYTNKSVDIIIPINTTLNYIPTLNVQDSAGAAVSGSPFALAKGQKLSFYFSASWNNISQIIPINTRIQEQTVVNGGTVVVSYNTRYLRLSGAIITSYTVRLPEFVYDGREVTIFSPSTSMTNISIQDFNSTAVATISLGPNYYRNFVYSSTAGAWELIPL
jgi:hypothetical protein